MEKIGVLSCLATVALEGLGFVSLSLQKTDNKIALRLVKLKVFLSATVLIYALFSLASIAVAETSDSTAFGPKVSDFKEVVSLNWIHALLLSIAYFAESFIFTFRTECMMLELYGAAGKAFTRISLVILAASFVVNVALIGLIRNLYIDHVVQLVVETIAFAVSVLYFRKSHSFMENNPVLQLQLQLLFRVYTIRFILLLILRSLTLAFRIDLIHYVTWIILLWTVLYDQNVVTKISQVTTESNKRPSQLKNGGSSRAISRTQKAPLPQPEVRDLESRSHA